MPVTVTIVAAGLLIGLCAVWTAPDSFRVPVAIGTAAATALLAAACTAAVYYRQQAARARAEARATVATVTADAAARLNAAQDALAAAREAAAHAAREAAGSEDRRSAALAAFAGAAGRIQAMSTSMLAELRAMEHRHGDPDVLADLLELDHRTAQTGRLADSIVVLCGARSGRRWAKPIAMESILRGALGRVAGYQRVRLRSVTGMGIAGHAAEGIMHALAELIDNACNFSPPTTEVHVYAAEVPAGLVVTIEDSGLVMSESALRRAEQAVSGSSRDLASLTGTRLGLAVVGHLSRKHGLTVSFRPSAIGGTAVVMVVPRELTTAVIAPTTATAAPVPAAPRAAAHAALRSGASTTAPVAPPAPAEPVTVTELLSVTTELIASDVIAEPVRPETLVDADPASAADTILTVATPSWDPEAAAAATLPRRRRGSAFANAHPEGLNSAAAANRTPVADRPATMPSALGAFQRAFTPQTSTPPED
ncbi:sensor histidine kinase [Nocardia stercoris]|uniref:histidine kinase n=1 Tax=Nocardia stercoris TaxID=2483361 RepID=A0A3M2LC92_9NOCA|nr:ATP-binding protein [Nocardia stercoris]RMI35172.1 ATP-binding protein [Nocardia stercoris]